MLSWERVGMGMNSWKREEMEMVVMGNGNEMLSWERVGTGMGMGMGMTSWEWEGLGTVKVNSRAPLVLRQRRLGCSNTSSFVVCS